MHCCGAVSYRDYINGITVDNPKVTLNISTQITRTNSQGFICFTHIFHQNKLLTNDDINVNLDTYHFSGWSSAVASLDDLPAYTVVPVPASHFSRGHACAVVPVPASHLSTGHACAVVPVPVSHLSRGHACAVVPVPASHLSTGHACAVVPVPASQFSTGHACAVVPAPVSLP